MSTEVQLNSPSEWSIDVGNGAWLAILLVSSGELVGSGWHLRHAADLLCWRNIDYRVCTYSLFNADGPYGVHIPGDAWEMYSKHGW